MALISEFVESSSERHALHPTTVTCGWLAFTSERGPVLQLDTYGSTSRKLTGKASQSIQLDRAAAAQLLTLIDRSFPGLRPAG